MLISDWSSDVCSSDLVVCALCLLAVVYPYAIYPAILARLPERPLRPVAAVPGRVRPLRLSLAFCAYNEAAVLPAKIANLRRLREAGPELEILPYSDGRSDATAALLRAEDSWLRVFAAEERHGNSPGINTMVQAAQGAVVVFTDANETV